MDTELTGKPYEAYVVEEKKLVRLNGWYSNFGGCKTLSSEWEQRKQFRDVWGRTDLVFPWDATILEGSTAENSKLDIFLASGDRARPATYLKLWKKRPNIENLVVQGCGALVVELIDDEKECEPYLYPKPKSLPQLGIFWKEKRPAQMLGLDKGEFQRCISERWNAETWHFVRDAKEKGFSFNTEELQLCKKLKMCHCRTALNGNQNPVHVARYLNRQKKKDARCGMTILTDYWRMAAQLGHDLDNRDIRYPSRLYPAHDRVTDQINRERDVKDREKNAEQYAKIVAQGEALSIYAWERDGISIHPVRNIDELKEEGKALHHCVSSYATQVADGQTAIFLIRRTEHPDVSWYTLELSEKTMTVRQNRGSRNCDKTAEVQAFEDAWIIHIRELATAQTKSKQKSNKAVTAA